MTPLIGADGAGLKAAAAALAAGEVVAIPTDTVYGLAVDPTVPGATGRLFDLKGRPRRVPIAVLVADLAQAEGIAAEAVPDLAGRHWPGALTVVVRRRPEWPADLGDEGGTVGLRCPDHAWTRALCRRVGPLATTSANLHTRPSLLDAAAVAACFLEGIAVVLDGGVCDGEPSTVVDCTAVPPAVLRQGAVVLEV